MKNTLWLLQALDKTPQQMEIAKILEDHWLNMSWLIEGMVDIAQNAVKSTPTGDEIPDHKTRLAAYIKLAEMSWLYKKNEKQWKLKSWLSNFLLIWDADVIDWDAQTEHSPIEL